MEQFKAFFSNKYVGSVLLFVLIVGGYVVYQNITYYFSSTTTTQPGAVAEETNDIDSMQSMESINLDEAKGAEDPYKGIHIMQNGDVMLGSGEVLEDALVTPEGMIELPDGTTLLPLMDLRK